MSFGIVAFITMPIIRFVREARDVECENGANLREVALKEGLQLYGFKGAIGNCGGYGQCTTCFVSIEGGKEGSLSPRTEVEKVKLKNRPKNWRLACQCIVKSSLIVMTKTQSPTTASESLIKEALIKVIRR